MLDVLAPLGVKLMQYGLLVPEVGGAAFDLLGELGILGSLVLPGLMMALQYVISRRVGRAELWLCLVVASVLLFYFFVVPIYNLRRTIARDRHDLLADYNDFCFGKKFRTQDFWTFCVGRARDLERWPLVIATVRVWEDFRTTTGQFLLSALAAVATLAVALLVKWGPIKFLELFLTKRSDARYRTVIDAAAQG